MLKTYSPSAASLETKRWSPVSAISLKSGVPAFVLKRGARGSTVIHSDGRRADVPPFRVEVLNVLGAGDAFTAAESTGVPSLNFWPSRM